MQDKQTLDGILKNCQIEIAEVLAISGRCVFVPDRIDPAKSVAELFERMCNIWGVPLETLKDASRKKQKVMMRNVLWAAGRKLNPHLPFAEIGAMFNRDHTSIMHGISTFKDLLFVNDPVLMNYYTPVSHLFPHE